MTHPHDQTEACIDRVLNALRDTQPSPGLNARIADRIAQATDARTVTTPFFAVILNAVKAPRILFTRAPLYAYAATPLVILAALSLIVLHSRHPTTTQSQLSAPAIQSQSYAQNREAGAAQNPNISTRSQNAKLQPRPPANTPNTVLVAEAASIQPPATTTDPDTIALAETLAPSHPAPPMPLTQQELLTLAVLRSGDKEEIAALNPAQREALFAQEQAAFHDFFPTPTPATTTGDKE